MTDRRHQGQITPRDTVSVRKPSRMARLGTMDEVTVALKTLLMVSLETPSYLQRWEAFTTLSTA